MHRSSSLAEARIGIHILGDIFTTIQSLIKFSHYDHCSRIFGLIEKSQRFFSRFAHQFDLFNSFDYKMSTSELVCFFASVGGKCDGTVKHHSDIHQTAVRSIKDNSGVPSFENICDFHKVRFAFRHNRCSDPFKLP